MVPSDLYRYADGKELGYTVKVNGEPVSGELEDGYFVIDREWKQGDVARLHFDMEPRLVEADEQVEDDRGRLAVERGPLVYCAEWPDNTGDVLEAQLPSDPQFTLGSKEIAGTDVVSISTDSLTLIPYYAWAHRGQGQMAVWLKRN